MVRSPARGYRFSTPSKPSKAQVNYLAELIIATIKPIVNKKELFLRSSSSSSSSFLLLLYFYHFLSPFHLFFSPCIVQIFNGTQPLPRLQPAATMLVQPGTNWGNSQQLLIFNISLVLCQVHAGTYHAPATYPTLFLPFSRCN